jgi:hypothetical protein
MKKLDDVSHSLLVDLAKGSREEQIHIATYVVKPNQLTSRGFNIQADADSARILRSVLMKPEHEAWVPRLNQRISELTRQLIAD